MMLSLLLARSGVKVVLLEKHSDFLRDFRGDTVHPSTLQVLSEIGLLDRFNTLPQHRVHELSIAFGERMQAFVDFNGLKPFDYLALVPQWNFLDLLAQQARTFPGFDLHMSTQATGIIEEGGRVVGVRAKNAQGELQIRADLVIGTDGRHSTLSAAAGLVPVNYGAPMDVLWFRLPRNSDDPKETFGRAAFGHLMVLLNRDDYWQAAFVVAKGEAEKITSGSIQSFREMIGRIAPFLAGRTDQIASWEAVKLLEVKVNRLRQWHRPGLLLIGDAAHAMSPVGGVGINLAVQDAVATANILGPALMAGGEVRDADLNAVQQRRQWPTRVTQAVQLQVQKRVISHALSASGNSFQMPAIIKWLLRFRRMRNIPARLFGYGVRQEHVHFNPITRA
jgi:2-polyprenyl-6-methoxyphenol hydroxylase-like FAD-dependent oxidoreductase